METINSTWWNRLDASNDNGSHPEESTFSALDKKIRAVKKKLKQADVLRDRQKAGDTLTGPELEKLKNAETWFGLLCTGTFQEAHYYILTNYQNDDKARLSAILWLILYCLGV